MLSSDFVLKKTIQKLTNKLYEYKNWSVEFVNAFLITHVVLTKL